MVKRVQHHKDEKNPRDEIEDTQKMEDIPLGEIIEHQAKPNPRHEKQGSIGKIPKEFLR